MNSLKTRLVVVGLSLLWMCSRAAVSFTTIASFNGTNGANPVFLVPNTNGGFFGTAASGGNGFNGSSGGNGVIFELTSDGQLSNRVAFTAGQSFPMYMIQAADQHYYGTMQGGNGSLFKLSPDGDLMPYNPTTFGRTNGEFPVSLIQDEQGNIFGVNQMGGLASNSGTVFRIDTNGVYSNLAYFERTNGALPIKIILGRDGNFYGTTSTGGIDYRGVVFKMTRAGELSTIHYCDDEYFLNPAWLIQGSDGHLYGTTGEGGIGFSLLFKMSTAGELIWTVPFNGTNGSFGAFLMEGPDHNFYGTAYCGGEGFNGSWISGYGTIFKITPDGELTSLFAFRGTNGSFPGFMTIGQDGNFYGTTDDGGVYGRGTVFRLSLPLAPTFQSIERTGNNIVLTWSSVAGQNYQLQYKTNLTAPDWIDLGSPVVAETGRMSETNSIGIDLQRIYRVILLQ